MTSSIILKKSSVAAKVPVEEDLVYGEVALNYADGKLYYKKADNTIDYFSTSSTGSATSADSFSVNSLNITTNATPAVFVKDDNLTAWNYSGKTFSIVGEETGPAGVFFKPDGSAMYMIGTTGDDVNQYSLGVAWDISTAVFARASVSIGESSPGGVFFKPDGLALYVVGSSGDAIREFSLSTAWDVSTIAFVRTFSVSAQDSVPQDLWFKPDGTKMYVVGSTNDRVYEYNLSTAWNVSTASFLQFFSVATQELLPVAINFNADGTKMYVLGQTGFDINRYSLSTPWDISTAVFFNNFYVGFQATAPTGLFINFDSGTAYVVCSTTDAVHQYTTLTDGIELTSKSGLYIDGSLYTNKNLFVTSGSRLDGTLSVSGATTLQSSLSVGSTATFAGSVTLASTTGTLSIGTSQTAGTTTIGGILQTGLLTIGRSTAAQTLDLAVGASTSGITKIVNIGTNGLSGSTTDINIGSAVSGSLGTTTINSALTTPQQITSTLATGTAPFVVASTTRVANLNVATAGIADTATSVDYSGLTGTVPTWNQDTTGNAANVTGIVAIANGGTGATTAANALTNLGAYAASNPAGYTTNVGTVTSVETGTGLTGGPITSTGTISLSDTAVVPGDYTAANITVDAQGRITAASNGSSGGTAGQTASFGITIDGGGSVITTGVKGYVTVPYNCTITGWTVIADVSGSLVVDVWKDSYANYPPTSLDSIAGSQKPTLSNSAKNQNLNVTAWSTTVNAGDVIGFSVESATSVKRVHLSINITKV